MKVTTHTFRARFAKDIVTEFLLPRRPSRKVIIFLDGMPTIPSKKRLLEFWSQKGFWVFHPRYRGTWESEGSFLKTSPERDILDLIAQLPRGFKSIWDGKYFSVQPTHIYLFGSSFGGAGALLASRDKKITKAIVLAPAVDWRVESRQEPIRVLRKLTKDAFGEAYRFSKKDWKKFEKGNFYNPMLHASEIRGEKILIFHAKDDLLVPWHSVSKFAEKTKSTLVMFKKGGHFSLSEILRPKFYKYIKIFLLH